MSESITPAHLLAYPYLLHPEFKGVGLTETQIEEAKEWVYDRNPIYLNYVVSFQGQSDPFPKSYFKETLTKVNPSAYWRSLENVLDIKFVEFIAHLMYCPSSSASIERVFSNFSYVISKIRNKLGLEKASKLVSIFRTLNKKNIDIVDW